jgi:4-hydroxy-tetrahydrodipicolinate reductase
MSKNFSKDGIKVVIAGAAGRMGQEAVKAVNKDPNVQLVGAVGSKGSEFVDKDLSEIVGGEKFNITLSDNLKDTLQRTKPDVLLDLSVPLVVYDNACIALDCGVRPVIGATGLTKEDLLELEKKAKYNGSSVLIAPNFAIGALMMIHFSKLAAKYFDSAEIIEIHHDKKVDAPSGTAIKTALEIGKEKNFEKKELTENMVPRGELIGGVRVHSLRLPGAVAHQEVIFGTVGQTLTIRHDTIDRTAFMPSVLIAIKEIVNRSGLIYGLENIIFENL